MLPKKTPLKKLIPQPTTIYPFNIYDDCIITHRRFFNIKYTQQKLNLYGYVPKAGVNLLLLSCVLVWHTKEVRVIRARQFLVLPATIISASVTSNNRFKASVRLLHTALMAVMDIMLLDQCKPAHEMMHLLRSRSIIFGLWVKELWLLLWTQKRWGKLIDSSVYVL